MVAEVAHNQSGRVDQARLLARYGSIPIGYLQKQSGYGRHHYQQPKPQQVRSLISLIFYQQSIPTELQARLKNQLPKPQEDRVAITAEDALPASVGGKDDNSGLPLYRRNSGVGGQPGSLYRAPVD